MKDLYYVIILCITCTNPIWSQRVFSHLGIPAMYIRHLKTLDSSIDPRDAILEIFENDTPLKFVPKNSRAFLRVGNTETPIPDSLEIVQLESTDGEAWVDIISNFRSLDYASKKIFNWKGWFSNNAWVHIQIQTDDRSTAGATFSLNDQLINLGFNLPFGVHSFDALSKSQKEIVAKKFKLLAGYLDQMRQKLLTDPENIQYKGGQLTAAERILGLTQFWSEVKYNFAFFDQVPTLNWNEELTHWIPIVQAEQSTRTYYNNLSRFCALLKDGHTNIYPPGHVRYAFNNVPIKIWNLNRKPIITNVHEKLSSQIKPGFEIVSVNGLAVDQYLQDSIFPYISSGTEHILYDQGISRMLDNIRSDEISLEVVDLDGVVKTVVFPSEQVLSHEGWPSSSNRARKSEFEILNNSISYIQLNSFGNDRAVKFFESKLDSIRKSQGIIIDLRRNGGGSSQVGYDILKYFTDKPFLGSKWRTRLHNAAFKAWGQYYFDNGQTGQDETEWVKEKIKFFKGEAWEQSDPDTIIPDSGEKLHMPVVVLIGHNTASAAEDFLVASDKFDRFTTMGQTTFGSTGQPLWMRLPGGGQARICTKRDTYPDDREFVGYGIAPDLEIKRTIGDLMGETDTTLEAAIQFLNR